MTSTDTFPTEQQFRDDIAAIAAEVKRHREIEALLPELVAALDAVVRIVAEARDAWDSDRDARVGKILIAMEGKCPGYRADVDAIHATRARAKELQSGD